MKVAIFLVVIGFVVINGYQLIEPLKGKTEKGYCKSTSYPTGVMKVGEVKTLPGICLRATCGAGSITYHGCGSVAIPDGCKFIEPDLSLPYPKCCRYDFEC